MQSTRAFFGVWETAPKVLLSASLEVNQRIGRLGLMAAHIFTRLGVRLRVFSLVWIQNVPSATYFSSFWAHFGPQKAYFWEVF
jgi:hypothetical protein